MSMLAVACRSACWTHWPSHVGSSTVRLRLSRSCALLLRCCRAGEVRGIMEQNRQMLAERGERLQRLDERTAAMADDADDFASMAKQLADMQANRKWWQL